MTIRKYCVAALAAALLLTSRQFAWAAPPDNPVLIPSAEVDRLRERQDPFFLDVRSEAEIKELGSLPDYYNIPLDELEKRLDELPKDRMILTA